MTSTRRKRPTNGAILTVGDLQAFAPNIDETKAREMITDAMALAKRVAPCIFVDDADPDIVAAAKAIIRSAILRWNDQGSGSLQMLGADVFTMRIDNRYPRQAAGFYPSELKELGKLCGKGIGAYTIDLAPGPAELDEPPWMEFVDP